MKKLITFLGCLLLAANSLLLHAQPLVTKTWEARYNGPDSLYDYGTAIDMYGYIYETGGSYSNASGSDGVTIKYDTNGTQLWARTYNGSANGYDFLWDIVIDKQCNIYVAGGSQEAGTYADYLLIKYDSAGNTLWKVTYDGNDNYNPYDYAQSLALDDSGNVFVTGQSAGYLKTIKYSSSGIQQWIAAYTYNSSGMKIIADSAGNTYVSGSAPTPNGQAALILKYDAGGNLLWASTYEEPVTNYSQAAGLFLSDNSIYVPAYSDDTIYLLKYNGQGSLAWAAKEPGSGFSFLTADNGGNIYLAGRTFTSGTGADWIVVKYSPSGNLLWKRSFSNSSAGKEQPTGITIDPQQNIYVCGNMYSDSTGQDMQVIKYDSSGNVIWQTGYNGPASLGDYAKDVLFDKGSVYLFGYSAGIGTDQDITTIKYGQHQPAPGSSCANTISLTPSNTYNPTDIIMSGTEMWFSFVAGNEFELVSLTPDNFNNTPYLQIKDIVLYSGSCGNLTTVSEKLNADFVLEDTIPFFIGSSNLVTGQQYFVKIKKSENQTSVSYFGICVQNIGVPGTTFPACDIICNGGFENSLNPQTCFDASVATCWVAASGTADYYNSTVPASNAPAGNDPHICLNDGVYQIEPRNGYAHIGFGLHHEKDYREFIQTPVNLTAGKAYKVTFYVKRKTGSSPINVGFLLTPGLVNPDFQTSASYYQTVTGTGGGYIQISGSVVATASGTNFLTIGGFAGSTVPDWQYFYVDDVSMEETALITTSQQTICLGESVTISASNATNFSWTSNPAGFTSTSSSFTVAPTQTTTYTATFTTLGGCSHTGSITITVNPLPEDPIISYATSNIICQGENSVIYVTNTPFYTYQWELNGTLIPGATSSIYYATQAGVYTVSVTNSFGCEANSANSITVTVNPLPVVTLNAAMNDCGNSNQGSISVNVSSGTPPYTYQWDTDPVQTSPTATGLGAGTHTVTVTDVNGCNDVFQHSLISYPTVPLPTIVTGANITCDAGQYPFYIGGYDPNTYTYTWSTSISSNIQFPVNGATITFNDFSQPATVFLTATNFQGCSATTSITLQNCCYGSPVGFVGSLTFTNKTASEVLSQFQNFPQYVNGNIFTTNYNNTPNITVAINGIFTIDQPFRFDNANVIFGPNAKINIPAAGSFYVQNSSWLHQCSGKMWNGIYLNSGTVNINNSLIEDAENVIVSNGGSNFTVYGSTFNKNYKNIVVNSTTLTHPGTIRATNFRCDAFLLPPHPSNIKTYSGVEFTDVLQATVGDFTNAIYANTFTAMSYGIKITRSSVNVHNNAFENIQYGIYSLGTQLATLTNNIGGNGLRRNYFTKCDYGLFAEESQNINIRNNYFTNSYGFAIKVDYIGNKEVNITNNLIRNFSHGIVAEEVFNTKIRINSNTITQGLYPYPSGTNIFPPAYPNFAVAIENIPTFSTMPPAYIKEVRNNSIFGPVIGVKLLQSSKTNIVSNNIVFAFTNSEILNNPLPAQGFYAGVLIEGGFSNQVAGNTIQRGIYNNSTFIPTDPDLVNLLRGIEVRLSQQNIIKNNTIRRFGAGIRMEAVVTNSEMLCNTFERCYQGIDLVTATMSNQGLAGAPTDNSWLFSVGANKIKGSTTNSNPSINWYYKPAGNFNVFPNVIGDPPVFIITKGSGCGGQGGGGGKVQQREQLLGAIVRNERQFSSFDLDNKFTEKQYAFRVLKTDSLLQLGEPDDATFQNFYDAVALGNTGKINQAQEAIAAGDLSLAALKNSSIVPANQQEQNIKTLHEIYMQTWAVRNKELNDVQRGIIEDIACQEPLTGGEAVFGARKMLGVDFICPLPALRLGNNVAEESEPEQIIITEKVITSKIYPNPNNGIMQMDYVLSEGNLGIVEILDISGKQFLQLNLIPEKTTVFISDEKLLSGIYLYRISVNGEIVHNEKLVIIR